jgi:glutamine synthetase
MSNELRNFLALSYDELEELNLKAKEQRRSRVATHKVQEERLKYLTDEKRIKAVTVLFSDLEGRLHMLDYDKKFLIKSWDNLTFDGSSIRGFTAQRSTGLQRMSLARAKSWSLAKSSTRGARLTLPTFAAH